MRLLRLRPRNDSETNPGIRRRQGLWRDRQVRGLNTGLVFSVSSMGVFGAVGHDKFIADNIRADGDKSANKETSYP